MVWIGSNLSKPSSGKKVTHFNFRKTKNRQLFLQRYKTNLSNFRGTKNIFYPNLEANKYKKY